MCSKALNGRERRRGNFRESGSSISGLRVHSLSVAVMPRQRCFRFFLVSDDVYILFKIYVLNILISLLFHMMYCAHIVANYFCANEIVVNVPL